MSKKLRLSTEMNGNDPELSTQNPAEEKPNPATDMQVSVEIGGNKVELALNKEEEREYDKMLDKVMSSIPPERALNHDDMPEAEVDNLLAGLSNSSDDASGSPNKVSPWNVRGWNTSEVQPARERRSPSRPKSCDPPNSISVTVSIRYPNDCQSDATQDCSMVEDRCLDEKASSPEPEKLECDPVPSKSLPNRCPPRFVRTEVVRPDRQLSTKRKVTDNLLKPSGRKHQWYTCSESRIYCHMKDETEESPLYYLDYLSLTDRCPKGACDIRPEEDSQLKSCSLYESVQRSKSRRNTNTGNMDTGESMEGEPEPIGRRHQWYTCGGNRVFCHMKNKQNGSPNYYLDYSSLTDRCPNSPHSFQPQDPPPRSRSERRSTSRASQQRRSRTVEDNVNNHSLLIGRRHQWFTCGNSRIDCRPKDKEEGFPFSSLGYFNLMGRCPHGSCRFETEANLLRCQSENRFVQGTKSEKRSQTAVGHRNSGNFVPIGRRH
nr:expressed protein [Hymenolepis microstoma]